MNGLFAGPRYITRGVNEKIPVELQLILWLIIDNLKRDGIRLDYLQVFELSPDMNDDTSGQKIIHSQEKPPYRREHILKALWQPISCRVWVIDDGDHSTMLLPEEY